MTLSLPTVLVVDDDPNIRRAVDRSLKRNGYRSLLAETAEDAIDTFSDNAVDVILLDLRLPGMDGHSFLRLVHRGDDRFPVVMMSGAGTMDDAIRAMRLNASDFLQKPFDDEDLVRALDGALAKRRKQAEGAAAAAPAPAAPGPSLPLAGPAGGQGPSEPAGLAPNSLGAELAGFASQFAPGAPTTRAGRRMSARRPATASAPPPPPVVRPEEALSEVEKRLAKGTLALPILDDRIGRVQELMERPSCGVDEVLEVVGEDPALASLCLRMANSSYYNSGAPIGNIRQACVQIGNRRVVALAVEALVKNAFVARREPFAGILDQLWRNSLITARLADRFARIVFRTNQADGAQLPQVDNLYVAALLHNIGELLLLQLFSQVEGVQVQDAAALATLAGSIESRHEVIGARLARKWRLPPLVIRLVGHHHRPTGPHESGGETFVRQLVLAAWSVACDAGYRYFPQHEELDVGDMLTAIHIDPARVEPFYDQMENWISGIPS